jgi:hypothetical protein
MVGDANVFSYAWDPETELEGIGPSILGGGDPTKPSVEFPGGQLVRLQPGENRVQLDGYTEATAHPAGARLVVRRIERWLDPYRGARTS